MLAMCACSPATLATKPPCRRGRFEFLPLSMRPWQESCITYQVGLPGGRSLLCRMFLVFDEPRAVEAGQADAAAGAAGEEVAGDSGGGRHYCW